ncbi:5'/3'-nucleotidase SurE [Candidatus Dojkabacteria bacterium]|nr:5'/3'-nucleotidase SurE [Candidatus Dojkabacteria bacterium]
MNKILLTNDDGIEAPGLLALLEILQDIAKITVVAPMNNQSSCSLLRVFSQNIPYEERQILGSNRAIAVDSTTADCIGIAALLLEDWPPDLVVSGINPGENSGYDVLYSGTVAGALEASVHGVPSLAVSLLDSRARHIKDYEAAGRITKIIIETLISNGIPPNCLLNLNIPRGPVKGIKVTAQGQTVYDDSLITSNNMIRVEAKSKSSLTNNMETDTYALRNGYATLTPLKLDMTAYDLLTNLKKWNLKI